MNSAIERTYYNPSSSGGLGGKRRLINQLRERGIRIPADDINAWLKSQIPYTVHKDIRKNFKRNRVVLTRINETFFTDLVDMQQFASENDGYKYIITIIDGFSKFAWARALRSKSYKEVIGAFSAVFKQRQPENVSSDAGSEFNNKYFKTFLKERDINFYVMRDSRTKCPVIERFNRTIKERMFRFFTKQGNHRYIDILDDLLVGYNNSVHRTIRMKPIDVVPANEKQLFFNTYGVQSIHDIYKENKVPRNDPGENVRVQKELLPFRKGYLPKWSEEIFTINRSYAKPNAPTYSLKDKLDRDIVGQFYPEEIQTVENPSDSFYRIDKILKTKGTGSNKKHLIRWLGYSPEFDSWIFDKDIKKFVNVN